jgi:hypothetical protein
MTSWDVLNEGKGVCRDYAHLAITFCRCMNIPARYCTGYLGDIGVPPPHGPMDFAGWFEAYLGGRWYTFDARNNIPRIGRVLIAQGRDAADVPITHTCGYLAHLTFLLAELAKALIESNERVEAAAVLEEGWQRYEVHGDGCFWPELLRLKGELARHEGSIEAAEDCLLTAMTAARQQGALMWQLRAATQLARLRYQTGRPAAGIEVLQPIFRQFNDELETPDVKVAGTLLAQCAG